jgi:SAM-dependent methyltransferase
MAAGYAPQHFAVVAAAERRHFWFRARNRVLLTVLAPLGRRMLAGARVLEIGCGTGNTLRVLEQACPTALVVGMDLFAEGLQYARRETRAHLLQGRAEAAPFRTPFDLIGLFDVLEHIDRDAAALVAIRDLLAPGGHLVLTVPARRSLWSDVDVAARHARRYERDELVARLDTAGFDVRYVTPFMTATYPALWLSRRLRRADAQAANAAQLPTPTQEHDESVYAELRVNPWVNAAFDASLRPERWIVRAGRRLPFGSSLLAVAVRR